MLEGKVAIITGGSRGIGLETAKRFLEEGARVIIFGHSETSISKALNTLIEINPKYDVVGMCPDLTNLKMLNDSIEEIIKKYEKIDILVNNAGIDSSTSIYEYDDSEFGKVMSINVEGVFNTTKAVIDAMKETGGSIINVSSAISFYDANGGSLYMASKEAINGLTKSLSKELAKDNIRVNAVAPGFIHTDMLDTLNEQKINDILAESPMGRIGEPKEVAEAILFLASPKASFISGTVLTVDGGYTA